jgi:hypothetical protein
MANPSNSYAEKVFAEHPLALWAFDDNIHYVSLLNSNDKIMYGWNTSTNLSFNFSTTQKPFVQNSPIIAVDFAENIEPGATSKTGTITSINPIIGSLLDSNKNTFNVSTYFRASADTLVKIGYIYESELPVYEEFNYVSQTTEPWALLSTNFEIPGPGDIKIYIEISQNVVSRADVFLNNFSVGQWSESFVSHNSGSILEELSSYRNINLPESIYAVPSQAYGLRTLNSYHLASTNKLFAYNDGFPLVYGASDVTKIEPNSLNDQSLPSLIIPGFGFLNENGKYLDLTVEFWTRINSSTYLPKKIFGPISSNDGIYVKGEFIIIKVGNSYGSYFVGEWGRPMLIHFRVSQNTASLLIDGEQVISLAINTANISMPKPFSSDGKEQDWLGFYSYDQIDLLEVDCFAIYGYQIPEIVAKRRFIYGQGVEFPELSSSSLIASSAFIDYRVSGYANNFIYPDMAKWNSGISDNVLLDSKSIKTPQYSLPSAFFTNSAETYESWIQKAKIRSENNDEYGSVSLSESNSDAGNGGYLYFDNLNIISSKVAGIYGIFKNSEYSDSSQILFKILNKANGAYLNAELIENKIVYTLVDEIDTPITITTDVTVEQDDIFVFGINIRALGKKYGGRITKFFGTSKNLAVYVAGQTDNGESTFYGDIYRFAFLTERSINKIIQYFSDSQTHISTIDQEVCDYLLGFTASYTLKPSLYIDSFELDIATDSYWQDYVPLSRIDGSVRDMDGSFIKRLSFLQFNADVPVLKKIVDDKFDTSGSQIKMYITFQYLSTGPNVDHRLFLNTKSLSKNKIVIPSGSWIQTKYEVVDDSIIYLPQNVDYNKLAIVLHVEIQNQNSLRDQVKIKTIQLASQALSDIEPKKITTRFGDSLFSYVLRGIYPDYSSRNAISIYKGSTPYLYLTNTSGIKLVGGLEDNRKRGIRYVLNEQASNLYRIGASQLLLNYYEDTFSQEPRKLLSYKAFVTQNGIRQERIVGIYVAASNSEATRGRVYAIDEKTGLADPTIYFYLNGKLVKDLHITPKTWSMVGLQFRVPLDVNSSIGYVDINGPILVHGISNYRLTSIQDAQSFILRSWSQVLNMIDKGGQITNWQDFLSPISNPEISWENVLYIPTVVSFFVDAALPFRIYTGTNKIIVGDENKLRFNRYEYRSYRDVVWQSSIFDAV